MVQVATQVLTIEELAHLLKVSTRTIYRMLEDNELPFAMKIKGCWRFQVADVLHWMDAQKIGTNVRA